ncbi:hypothetical protein FH972_026805 [Carpinus fangiana]|uniref:Protein ENDOSPERM DEFECTIVE 1 n=1 Tax=Carpinus fangiana TaxID=176857 RepID=A0A5N6L7K6_9ROSI|nr:hypothetical protein FH972_026805 [Carpinus fangiana]
MNELVADKPTTTMVVSPPPPPPPPPPSLRRPRVREVSSRFMSPLISSPLAKQQRSTSVHRQRHMDPLCSSDENRPTESIQIQSLETSPTLGSRRKAALTSTTSQRKQRAVAKLFKENAGKIVPTAFTTPSRPDTPTLDRDRMILSRFRRSTNMNISVTAAAKLLQSSGMSAQPSVTVDPSSMSDDDNNQNPLLNCTATARSLPDFRCSMPEADMLPTVSTRLLAEKSCTRSNTTGGGSDSLKLSASPCSRSLNFPLSVCEKQAYGPPKPPTNSVKMGGFSLPPVPPCTKLGTDNRKGKKVSSHQEDVHTLRLLHNRYLQWRYANAKAEASIRAQQTESERTLHSLGVKISEFYDSVKRKHIELGLLQRTKTLSTILEAQIPYLTEWSALEEDYSIYLSEAIQALLNASLQLPIVNVRADIGEVGEALNSGMKVIEIIIFHLQSFMPKAEEADNLISEVARVSGGEKALIEECGDLLSKTCTSQVKEFSLRSQLVQLHRFCHLSKN